MSAVMDADDELETRIDDAYRRMTNAIELQTQRNAWQEMVILVRQRSAAQILRMENERRIAR